MDENVDRKLAAIMFTDIKGFSKKMGENESEAFEVLKTHDALMRVMVTKNGGKVIKSIGDSFMVDFSSAVNAVKCALDAQKKFYTFNKDKDEFHKIEIRIGIHLGDVIMRDNDIFGDGVNIAQRIEAITEPNRICVSSDVFNQVKKKMSVQGHAMGGMKLKNIADPVDVFEILIPEILEFSTPSRTAREAISQTQVDASIQQDAEEAKEAQRVEQAKERVSAQHEKAAEKVKILEQLYAESEKYYQNGQQEDAERILAEIATLDPNYRATLEKRHDDEQKEKAAQLSLNKATELIKQRKFKEAEEAVNEVFTNFPLHVGAQQMLLQIEEDRYKVEEDARIKKSTEAITIKSQSFSEEEKKKAELFDRARTRLANSQFQEALEVLREVFQIDPNNGDARLLEEEIRLAETKRIEASKRQAEEEADQIRRNQAETQRRLEENERKRAAQLAAEIKRKNRMRTIVWSAVSLVLGVGLWFVVPPLWRQIFPNTASVAVVQFNSLSNEQSAVDLAYTIPYFLAEDLARCAHVTVASPSSSLTFANRIENVEDIAAALNVQYVVTGTIKEQGSKYSIAFRVVDTKAKQSVFAIDAETDVLSLARTRSEVIRAFLQKLQIESRVDTRSKSTENLDAYLSFIHGFRLSQSSKLANLFSAEESLKRALDVDPTFTRDASSLADVLMTQFELGTRSPRLLQEARQLIEIQAKPSTNSFGLLSKARFLRLNRKLEEARAAVESNLLLEPLNSDAMRELAMIEIMAGNFELATEELTKLKTLDPKNPKTFFVQGLAKLRNRVFAEADVAFQKAIELGMDDSLTTLRFRIPALLGAGTTKAAMEFLDRQLSREPQNLQFLYLKGRIEQANVSKDYQMVLDNALAIARHRVEMEPADLEARSFTALLLTRLGRFDDGRKELEQLGTLGLDPIEYAFLKSRVFSIQKKKVECISALKELVRLESDIAKLVDSDLSWIAQEPEFQNIIALGKPSSAGTN
jgi:class 3 adenylate cyclase/Flp pilus assembly protein TadD/TolB-like protein